MADCWDLYLEKYKKEPQSAEQLRAFAQRELQQTINFKQAREICDSHKSTAKPSSDKKSVSTAPPLSTTSTTSASVSASTTSTTAASTTASATAMKTQNNDEKDEQLDTKTALFQQLNQSNVGGLKHIDRKKEKIENKPETSPPKVPPKVPVKVPPKEQTEVSNKVPGTLKKQGPRYLCENFSEGVQNFDQAGRLDEIFIYNCENSGFVIPGKVKCITIDHCKKIQVEVNEVISTVEMVHSESVTLFIKGTAPSITVDKCAQPRLVIFQEALDKQPKIITSMVTDMNVEVPPEREDLDWKVIAVPYQFETTIDPETKTAITRPVEHV